MKKPVVPGKPLEVGETARGSKAGPLAYRELVERLNRGYVCPADAGPAWRAANKAGVDMALLEEALAMSPPQRLRAHQRALDLVLAIQKARADHDSGS